MAKINCGEEITINYAPTLLFCKKRQERQKYLLERRHFICFCDFCKLDNEDENDIAFYEMFGQMYHEMENMTTDRIDAIKAELHYPASKCRRKIDLCKQMYKMGKEKKISPITMFKFLAFGVEAGVLGYQIVENEVSRNEFKKDCDMFFKTADKFRKILGNDTVDWILPHRNRMEEVMNRFQAL